jgi:hypothetical protein
MPGSRKPILEAVKPPGSNGFEVPKPNVLKALPPPETDQDKLLPQRDGSQLSAIQCLVEAGGDWEIAEERCQLSEADFAIELARCDTTRVAQGLRAIQLMQVAKLSWRVGATLMESLDEIKPSMLAMLYPKLLGVVPDLMSAKMSLSQTNNFYGADELPDDVKEAIAFLTSKP